MLSFFIILYILILGAFTTQLQEAEPEEFGLVSTSNLYVINCLIWLCGRHPEEGKWVSPEGFCLAPKGG